MAAARTPKAVVKPSRPRPDALAHATMIVNHVCGLAGSTDLIDRIQRDGRRTGLTRAIVRRDTPALFDWLMNILSYQGISDEVAAGYIENHGNATWHDIEYSLASGASCPKLTTYWRFEGCRYDKGRFTCTEPSHISGCRLPLFDLRNGRLNQTAYALFFFMRDIAAGDLIGWIDDQISSAPRGKPEDPFAPMRAAVIAPMSQVFGVSDKTVSMALASLLMAAPRRYRQWREIGASMIVVDSLVHNFLHRTGILRRFGAHLYGPGCYLPGRCADILRLVSGQIDARQFNPAFPENFPRFVQLAIWTFCSADGQNVCNGNQVDDSARCKNRECSIFAVCSRRPLTTPK